MNDKRLFSIDEANELIPSLELHFAQAMQLRGQLRTTYHALEALGAAPSGESLKQPSEDPEICRFQGRFRGLVEALTETLQAIEDTGVAVKDLDIGLCDFLGEVDGRQVWLCWQYGEKQVQFWHELDTGFGDRRPITRQRPQPRVLH